MKSELLFLAATSLWFCFWTASAGYLGLTIMVWLKKGTSSGPAVWSAVVAAYALLALIVFGWGVLRIQSHWEIFSGLSTLTVVLLAAAPFAVAAVLAVWLFRSLRFGW